MDYWGGWVRSDGGDGGGLKARWMKNLRMRNLKVHPWMTWMGWKWMKKSGLLWMAWRWETGGPGGSGGGTGRAPGKRSGGIGCWGRRGCWRCCGPSAGWTDGAPPYLLEKKKGISRLEKGKNFIVQITFFILLASGNWWNRRIKFLFYTFFRLVKVQNEPLIFI